MRLDHFFRLCVIIGSLPNNIQNGQVADANPLMADLNWIVNQVNANAAPIAGVALLQGNNTWSGTQTFQAPVTFLSGAAATANTVSTVPNAGQVQSWAFNTLSSVASLAGTNSYRGIAPLQASGLSIGQIWTFITSSPNNGPAQFGINSIASRPALKDGTLANLSSGDIIPGKVHMLATNSTSFSLLNPGPDSHGIQLFTNSGFFTPVTSVVWIDAAGGGSGGGGCAGVNAAAGGGTSGNAVKDVAIGVIPGIPISVTVGSGGAGGTAGANNGSAGTATSFGAFLTIAGGAAGGAAPTGQIGAAAAAGAGGGTGGPGIQTTLFNLGGQGGGNIFAPPTNIIAGAANPNGSANGASGALYGGGGTGGASGTVGGSAASGGAGANGFLSVKW